MFTYKAIGGAAFVLSYAVLLSLFPEFDLGGASLIAILEPDQTENFFQSCDIHCQANN
jgi:hypothetical protein